MFKSSIGAIIFLWAWRKWQAGGGVFSCAKPDDGIAVDKTVRPNPNPGITWDFSYMAPSGITHHPFSRRQKR
jgi:hypothetical protein